MLNFLLSRRAVGVLASAFSCTLALGLLVVSCSSEVVRDALVEQETTTPVDREPQWWQDRHAKLNQRVSQGADLLFIGDSITQGWNKEGAEVWKQRFEPRNAANLGISGDRTEHVLWRLRNGNLNGLSPKAAVLMIGTNNVHASGSQETADGVDAILRELELQVPMADVLLLAIFPRGADAKDELRQVNEAVNRRLEKLAGQFERVTYRDIGGSFTDGSGAISKDIMPDFVHLTPAGYVLWADAIEDWVAQHADTAGVVGK